MEIKSWRQARAAADALKGWLATHCPGCGKRHTKACIDGGRCMECGRMLCAVATLAEATAETTLLDGVAS